MHAGKADEGAAKLESLLRSSDNNNILNDAAYELADANRDLPLAEEKARFALSRMEEESSHWTLETSPGTFRPTTSLMVAAWDTMGWILFREHKLQEARSYIEAAWLNEHHSAVKQHLDAVNAALGIKPPAPKDAARPPVNASVVVTANAIGTAVPTLPAGKWTGDAAGEQFRLLLSDGAMQGATQLGEKTLDGGMAILARVNFSPLFPKGSHATLLRTGILTCFGGKCELTIGP